MAAGVPPGPPPIIATSNFSLIKEPSFAVKTAYISLVSVLRRYWIKLSEKSSNNSSEALNEYSGPNLPPY
jgi:hypothetical protein